MRHDTGIWVVIPNWNGAKFITECLESLEKQTSEVHVVVVDNNSSDNSVDLIEQKFPKVIVLRQTSNLGFAGGVNVGINYALSKDAEFVALLNNDAVADRNWLDKLVSTAKKYSKTGIVTGKILRKGTKTIDSTGEQYSIWGLPFPRGRNQRDKSQYGKVEEIFAASGGATLYKAKLFKDIGLFDERFFAYLEDVDISFRAKLSGWKVYYEPSAVVYHHVSATSSKLGSFTRLHTIKNFLMLYTKNMPLYLYLKYLPLMLLQLFRFGVTSTVKGQPLTFVKALFIFIKHLPAIVSERRAIQRSRTISVSEVDAALHHGRPPKIPKLR